MGIPSYFSYLVKTHRHIIKKIDPGFKTTNLFMDCNSIIYDIVNTSDPNTELTHRVIIEKVIEKIDEYIRTICPSHITYIAFDGVAPVAKLEQQRARRYKSQFQNTFSESIFKKNKKWNTAAITPGSAFMQELTDSLSSHYLKKSQNIIFSGSDEYGEGEHKLFEYIRNNPDVVTKDSVNVIYGLDSDLIMLALNHLPINSNMYLFRETPEFIKSIDRDLEPHETYMMDIPEMYNTLKEHMETEQESLVNRVYDYIFLCFFLGNDFMPHFPSLNIRTGGIDKLLGAYKETIGKTQLVLTDGNKIYWKNVFCLVKYLSDLEEEYFKEELKLRARRERYYPEDTPEQSMIKFESIPTIERDAEKFIDPAKQGWQKRYYHALFTFSNIENICINYLEGLEWTMKYYTNGCPDYRWKYKYSYPPLLSDLIKYIPQFDKTFIPEVHLQNKPVSQIVQLCYVLPSSSINLIPQPIQKKLRPIKHILYPSDCKFTWAFCRYFWEAHVDFPEINLDDLEILLA
jgi:5'-3' exonuclease